MFQLKDNWFRFLIIFFLFHAPFFIFNSLKLPLLSQISLLSYFVVFVAMQKKIFYRGLRIPAESFYVFALIPFLVLIELIGYVDGNQFGITIIRNLIYVSFSLFLIQTLMCDVSKKDAEIICKFLIILASFLSFLQFLSFALLSSVPSSEVIYICSIVFIFFCKYFLNKFCLWQRILIFIVLSISPIFLGVTGALLTYMSSVIFLINRKYINYLLSIIILVPFHLFLFFKYYSIELQDIYDQFLFVIESAYISEYDISESNNQAGSTYIRYLTNIYAIEEFLRNPILGSGNFVIKNEIQVAGYWTHTYLIYFISSYGLIGLIILSLILYRLFETLHIARKDKLRFFIIFNVMLLFTNEIYLSVPILFVTFGQYLKHSHNNPLSENAS